MLNLKHCLPETQGWLVILFQTRKHGAVMTNVTDWASVSLSISQTGSTRCSEHPQASKMRFPFSLNLLPLLWMSRNSRKRRGEFQVTAFLFLAGCSDLKEVFLHFGDSILFKLLYKKGNFQKWLERWISWLENTLNRIQKAQKNPSFESP